MSKPVAVILINYKKLHYTVACINSLLAFCDQEIFDIIVIDNASEDGSAQVIQKTFPQAKVIEAKENLGFAAGNNVGLSISLKKGYTFSLIINNDTIVTDNLIAKLLDHLDTNTNTVAVQPAIYWMHQRNDLWNGPGYYNKWIGDTYNNNTLNADLPVAADWLTGCCMLVRNRALRVSGLFNSKFFLYYEDVELSYRLKKTGRLDYLPTAKLFHEGGISGKTETKTSEGFLSPIIRYYVARNRLWFVRKYGVPLLYPFNFICIMGYYLCLWCYLLIKGRYLKAGMVLKGIKDGLFTPMRQIWVND